MIAASVQDIVYSTASLLWVPLELDHYGAKANTTGHGSKSFKRALASSFSWEADPWEVQRWFDLQYGIYLDTIDSGNPHSMLPLG